jgi:hypothetical protein
MTLLTTRKMDPALAARVEASVRGTRRPGSARVAPRVVAIARVAAIAIVVTVYLVVAAARRREMEETERVRKALLDAVRVPATKVTAADEASLARAESWLTRLSGPYDGDAVDSVMTHPAWAFPALFSRPTLYVRGPIALFTKAASITAAASESVNDALVLCLLSGPYSFDEAAIFSAVRDPQPDGSHLAARTASVHRLHDVQLGLPFLMPRWSERARTAAGLEELDPLRQDLEKAPLEEAARAAKARLLLVAMDEPDDAGGVAEPAAPDGERAHPVRVALVDLDLDRLLFRVRVGVDPSFIAPDHRAEYARAMDSCVVAIRARHVVAAFFRPHGRQIEEPLSDVPAAPR